MFQAIARTLGAIGRVLPVLILDLAGLCGAGLVAYGAWLITPPAGFITGGVLIMVGVVLASVKSDRPT